MSDMKYPCKQNFEEEGKVTTEDLEVQIPFDYANLEAIDKMISESSPVVTYGMQVCENGNGVKPHITEESRKCLAKSLLRSGK